MPLTNVSLRDPHHHGQWRRTTIGEIDRNFTTSISANSHQLMCNICQQYIIFVKGTSYFSSYFKHNLAEQDKECEDRTFGTSGYTGPGNMDDLPGLLRLRIGATRPHLEIGLYPVNEEKLQRAISGKVKIHITGPVDSPISYLIDRSRFAPHVTTWLPIHLSWAEQYEVSFSPSSLIPSRWKTESIVVSKRGSVFDGETMRFVPRGSDICIGKKYYILCGNRVIFGFRGGIRYKQLEIGNDQWSLFEFSVPAYTQTASDFLLERFGLLLTSDPAEITPIWPPVIERDDILETKQKELYLLLRGDSDFACYPLFANFNERTTEVSEDAKLIHLENVASLQMVSSYRYSQKLNAMYVSPWDSIPEASIPSFRIMDDAELPIDDDVIEKVPPRGILKVYSEVDASAVVEDQKGFLYRKEIPADQDVRLTDIKEGMQIIFRQGLTIVRRLRIGGLLSSAKAGIVKTLKPWIAEPMPFPARYAWLLNGAEPDSELYTRMAEALRTGRIPKDGLKYIMDWRRGILNE